jgi:hypothetical protein
VSVVCPGIVATAFGRPGADVPTGEELGDGIISAAAAAARIRSGMADRRFYVFTHDDSMGTVDDRFDRIRSGFAHSGDG